MGAIRNSVQAFSAGGMFLPGGSVIFGNENQRPDPDNPGTLKQVFTDVDLTTPAQNPQPLDSDAKFEQGGSTGTLYGSGVYSYVVLDASGVERTYVPSFTVISALTAQEAAEAAEAAQAAAEAAKQAAEDAAESITVPAGTSITIAIDTIAELRSLEPLFDGQQIELLGHTVAGIGGGVFYADFSDATTPDDNGTVIVTPGGRRWKRRLECTSRIQPEMFGAIGNGVTNDTSVLQAISAMNVSGRPGSVYFCNAPITISGQWEGNGAEIFNQNPSTTVENNAIIITGSGPRFNGWILRGAPSAETNFDDRTFRGIRVNQDATEFEIIGNKFRWFKVVAVETFGVGTNVPTDGYILRNKIYGGTIGTANGIVVKGGNSISVLNNKSFRVYNQAYTVSDASRLTPISEYAQNFDIDISHNYASMIDPAPGFGATIIDAGVKIGGGLRLKGSHNTIVYAGTKDHTSTCPARC